VSRYAAENYLRKSQQKLEKLSQRKSMKENARTLTRERIIIIILESKAIYHGIVINKNHRTLYILEIKRLTEMKIFWG